MSELDQLDWDERMEDKNFETYREYQTIDQAEGLINLLKEQKIPFHILNLKPSVDITFTGGSGLEKTLGVQIEFDKFEAVDSLIYMRAVENVKDVPDDHYLFEFTDDELVDILKNSDEWNEGDIILAQSILKERKIEISAQEIKDWKKEKIDVQTQPIAGSKPIMFLGWVSVILGGIVGFFVGYHYSKVTKFIPGRGRFPVYDSKTRFYGKIMFYAGFISVIIWAFIIANKYFELI